MNSTSTHSALLVATVLLASITRREGSYFVVRSRRGYLMMNDNNNAPQFTYTIQKARKFHTEEYAKQAAIGLETLHYEQGTRVVHVAVDSITEYREQLPTKEE